MAIIIRRITVEVRSSYLFLKNLALFRRLNLTNITYLNRLVTHNFRTELVWLVDGCHKINISDLGQLAGDANGVKFTKPSHQNPLEITFYGYRKTITKSLWIETPEITFPKPLMPVATIPVPISVPEFQNKITTLFALNRKVVNLEPRIRPLNVTVKPPSISIILPTFDINKYNHPSQETQE